MRNDQLPTKDVPAILKKAGVKRALASRSADDGKQRLEKRRGVVRRSADTLRIFSHSRSTRPKALGPCNASP
jgi:hypothetical protein